MNFLAEFLPIVIYILLIIVLLIGIILAIKFLITLEKIDRVVDNVNDKVRALDGLFHIIDTTTDKIVLVTDKVVEGVTSVVGNLFATKKKTTVSKVTKEKSTNATK